MTEIESTAEFNEQFTNYDREDVKGYELLTLVNKVIDYNTRKSSDTAATGTDKYEPIKLTIYMVHNSGVDQSEVKKQLTYDGTTLSLFTETRYIQSNTINQFSSILNTVSDIENLFGGADSATRLAKSIGSLYGSNINETEAVKKFNSYCTNSNTTVSSLSDLNTYKTQIYTYYEYVQFKRAIFKSNGITYDETTGRVITMEFIFTGKIY